jgi:hypothetical protein
MGHDVGIVCGEVGAPKPNHDVVVVASGDYTDAEPRMKNNATDARDHPVEPAEVTVCGEIDMAKPNRDVVGVVADDHTRAERWVVYVISNTPHRAAELDPRSAGFVHLCHDRVPSVGGAAGAVPAGSSVVVASASQEQVQT